MKSLITQQEFQSDIVTGSDKHKLYMNAVEEYNRVLGDKQTLDKVVDLFFNMYGNTLFIFFHRETFENDLRNRKICLPLLMSIYAIMARFVPDVHSRFPGGPKEASEYYFKLVRGLIHIEELAPSIHKIHIYILMSVYEIGHGQEFRAWISLGIAIRMSQILRLHRLDQNDDTDTMWGEKGSYQRERARRTFWAVYLLDKLFSNGNDRPSTFAGRMQTNLPSITTVPNENPAYTGSNRLPLPLLGHLMKLVEIQGRIFEWQESGGRHTNPTVPWAENMPFSNLERDMRIWYVTLPDEYKFPKNFDKIIVSPESNLWLFVYLLYFQAKCYLFREYLPFLSSEGYDPSDGPCDGPVLLTEDGTPHTPNPKSTKWWFTYTQIVFESCHNMTAICDAMMRNRIYPLALPLTGLALQTAGSMLVSLSHLKWPLKYGSGQEAENLLLRNIKLIMEFQKVWPLAGHWLRVLRRYYAMLGIYQHTQSAASDILAIKDDVINYVRELKMYENGPSSNGKPYPPQYDLFVLLQNRADEINTPISIIPRDPTTLEYACDITRLPDNVIEKNERNPKTNTDELFKMLDEDHFNAQLDQLINMDFEGVYSKAFDMSQ